MIPKSNSSKRIAENYDILFDLDRTDYDQIDQLMGEKGERGVRTLDMREYLGFNNFNEDFEEP